MRTDIVKSCVDDVAKRQKICESGGTGLLERGDAVVEEGSVVQFLIRSQEKTARVGEVGDCWNNRDMGREFH